jgi:hypothetical protein
MECHENSNINFAEYFRYSFEAIGVRDSGVIGSVCDGFVSAIVIWFEAKADGGSIH